MHIHKTSRSVLSLLTLSLSILSGRFSLPKLIKLVFMPVDSGPGTNISLVGLIRLDITKIIWFIIYSLTYSIFQVDLSHHIEEPFYRDGSTKCSCSQVIIPTPCSPCLNLFRCQRVIADTSRRIKQRPMQSNRLVCTTLFFLIYFFLQSVKTIRIVVWIPVSYKRSTPSSNGWDQHWLSYRACTVLILIG